MKKTFVSRFSRFTKTVICGAVALCVLSLAPQAEAAYAGPDAYGPYYTRPAELSVVPPLYAEPVLNQFSWYKLSAATKMELLMNSTYPFYRLEEILERAETRNSVDYTEELRAAISKVYAPALIEEMDLNQLVVMGKQIVETTDYREYAGAIRALAYHNYDQIGFSFMENLDEVYANISEKAKAFFPGIVDSIEGFIFINPVMIQPAAK